MRNNNLEIRIAGSSCRPQQATRDFFSEIAEAWYLAGSDFPRQLYGSIVLLTLSKILMVLQRASYLFLYRELAVLPKDPDKFRDVNYNENKKSYVIK